MSVTTTTQEPTMAAAPHVYVESDLGEDQTLVDYRRELDAQRKAERQAARRARYEDASWPARFVGRGRL